MPTICFSVNADAAAGEVRQAYRRKCVVHHACLKSFVFVHWRTELRHAMPAIGLLTRQGSPSSTIRRVRRASLLPRMPGVTVMTAATAVGVDSPSYLVRLFRKPGEPLPRSFKD